MKQLIIQEHKDSNQDNETDVDDDQENNDVHTLSNNHEKILLKGLGSLRSIANINDKDTRVRNIKTIRSKKNKNMMIAFVHYCLSHVVPSSTWSINRSEYQIRKIFTIQDEAFVLLVMMNNWKVWEQMAKGEKRDRGKNWDNFTLYTNKKKNYAGKEILIKGWSNDGMTEFNNCQMILKDERGKKTSIEMEDDIVEYYNELDMNKNGKRKRDNHDELILAERVMPLDGYCVNFTEV